MDDMTVSGSGSTAPLSGPESLAPPSSPPITTSTETTDSITNSTLSANPESIFFQLEKPIYITNFSKLMNTVRNELKEQLSAIDLQDATLFREGRISAIITAEDLLALENKLTEIGKAMNELYLQQVSDTSFANNAINSYNNQVTANTQDDQDAIDTMNAATDAYNDATNTYNNSDQGTDATDDYNAAIADYNAAIADYDAYIAARDSANSSSASTLDTKMTNYEAKLNQQNQKIAAINILRTEAGLSNLPAVSNSAPIAPSIPVLPVAPSTTNPVQLADAEAIDAMDNVAPPTVPPTSQQLIDQYLTPILDTILAGIEQLNTLYDNLVEFHDFERYYLGPQIGKIAYLPISYINRVVEAFVDLNAAVGAGAGAGLTSIITGLSGRNLNRLVGKALAANIARLAKFPLSPRIIDEVRLITLTILARAATGAGIPAFSLLSERIMYFDKHSPAIQIAISLALANQIAALGKSNDLQSILLKRLQGDNPLAPLSGINQAAASLAAASNLSLLLFTLSQTSQALNFPELTGLVLGLTNNSAVLGALQSASTTTVNDVIANPLSQAYLKQDLASALSAGTSLSDTQATSIARGLVLDGVQSESDLKASIQNQLIAKGVTADEATAASLSAASFVQAEIASGSILDTAIIREIVQRQYLNSELINRGINEAIAAQVVSSIGQTNFVSRRELRDKIANDLSQLGVNFFTARLIATEIVRNDQSGNLNLNPVSETALASTLSSRIIDQTSRDLGAKNARELAGQVVAALIGNEGTRPLSIVNLVKDQLTELEKLDEAALAESMRDFFKPTLDLYSFNNRIMNPANLLVLSVWEGIMYSTEGKKTESIDIIV